MQFSKKTIRHTLAAIAIASSFSSTISHAAERTMIILDGSGSMWGQIDGKPKLQIARETLREVLKGVPGTTELGLMAYGHRRKGDCGDIELVVPPAAGTGPQIADRVDGLKFLGKTPLTAAVQMAAKELRFTEDKATVVLITDGIETCEADVCAIGKLLEEQGVDFTAHVVGFGLSREEGNKIACLAENTGGQYISAGDSGGLSAALTKTVAAPVEPQIVAVALPNVTLIAVDQEQRHLTEPNLKWRVSSADGKSALNRNNKAQAKGKLKPGNYTVTVSGPDISGGGEFTIAEGSSDLTIQVPVEISKLLATVAGPAEAVAGAEFEVVWTGPNDKNDYVTIVKKGAKNGKYLKYAYTNKGSPAKISAPDGLGEYELRYFHNPSNRTLATGAINLTGVSATLDAPAEVIAGNEFEVTWTGPNAKSDYVTIVEKGAKEGKYLKYAYTTNGSPAKIQAPDGLGTYEVRYVFGTSGRTLESREITLTGVSATLEAPAEIAAGAEVEVIWTGPNAKSDYVTIVEKGAKEGKYLNYAYTTKGSPANIQTPDGLGIYELRYVFGNSRRTLASRDIKLTGVAGTLSVINTPVAGGQIVVEWTGPNYQGDYITIVEKGTPEGKYNKVAYTGKGSPATFKVPKALGAFEVRYVLAKSRRTLVSVPVTLGAATASVSAPTSAATGSVVEVTWSGPDNANDFIEIVAAGAKPNAKPVSKARTTQGSPLSLFAPGSAGDYEVRYKMGDSGQVLAKSALKIE